MFRYISIMFLVVILIFCGCKPANISDPIPTMTRVTITSHTDEFGFGMVGLESAFPLLEDQNINYKRSNISINNVRFTIERENVDSAEPYTVFLGKDSQQNYLFDDTLNVSEDIFTTFDERVNVSCSDPVWVIYSEHPIKVYVEMTLFVF